MRILQTWIPVWLRLPGFKDFSPADKEGKAWSRDTAFVWFLSEAHCETKILALSGLFKVIPGNSGRGVGKSDRERKETNKEFYIRQVTALVKPVLIPSGQLWEALQKVRLKLFQQRGREAEVCCPQTSHSSSVDGYFWDQKLVLLVCLEWATLSLWLKNHRCFQWAALGVPKWVPRHCGAIYLNTSYRYSGKNSNAQPRL